MFASFDGDASNLSACGGASKGAVLVRDGIGEVELCGLRVMFGGVSQLRDVGVGRGPQAISTSRGRKDKML